MKEEDPFWEGLRSVVPMLNNEDRLAVAVRLLQLGQESDDNETKQFVNKFIKDHLGKVGD